MNVYTLLQYNVAKYKELPLKISSSCVLSRDFAGHKHGLVKAPFLTSCGRKLSELFAGKVNGLCERYSEKEIHQLTNWFFNCKILLHYNVAKINLENLKMTLNLSCVILGLEVEMKLCKKVRGCPMSGLAAQFQGSAQIRPLRYKVPPGKRREPLLSRASGGWLPILGFCFLWMCPREHSLSCTETTLERYHAWRGWASERFGGGCSP